MKQRRLGRTNLPVSEISFGGVEIGLPYGIGVHSSADMPSDAESVHLLHQALELGITFFDTARAYGRSEEIMGKAFNDRREQVILCSKCSLPVSMDNGSAQSEASAVIRRSLQESLAALQTDYLDVLMLHNADLVTLNQESVRRTFADLREEGVIRATGVSTYSAAETDLAVDQGVWDVIQISFNLMDQRQAVLFDKAQNAGVGLVVRSVLLKGVLSDRGRNLHPALDRIAHHRDRYNDFFNETSPTLSVLATKFALSFDQVSSVLVGIDRLEYLYQAVAAADGSYLDETTLARLQALAFPEPEFIDLRTWDRMGWLR
ncbi:MAG TPA: aldo/keto reductase [bacterium]|nr:aldo/keto reductase [bacterium]HPN33332.1 aldo/keto reductase [bacterium]